MAVILVLGPARDHEACILKVFTEAPQHLWSSYHWALHYKNINHGLWVEYLIERQHSIARAGIRKSTGHVLCKCYTRPQRKPTCWEAAKEVHSALPFITLQDWQKPLGHYPKPRTECVIQTTTNYGLNEAEELLQIAGNVLLCLHYLVSF